MSTSPTSSNGTPPIIVARGLKHTYRQSKKVRIEALHGIDLNVRQGEILGLVGPDGAGKSTLLKALCGLIHPNEGTVTLAGEAPAKVRELIGYVSETGGVDPDLTVTENLSYVAGLHSIASGTAETRAAELLQRLYLEPVADRLVATIGGGRRRMLTLAGALLPDPDFIFLDEPTNAIDPMSQRACWELLSERARAGKTIVLATQFAWEADQCTRLAFMSGGTIRRIGTPAEIRDGMAETKSGAGIASQLEDAFDSVIAGLEMHRPPPFPFSRPLQHKLGDVAIRAAGLTKSFGKVEAVHGIILKSNMVNSSDWLAKAERERRLFSECWQAC
jgi:ABC-type multidrug transport system, ATPase component